MKKTARLTDTVVFMMDPVLPLLINSGLLHMLELSLLCKLPEHLHSFGT